MDRRVLLRLLLCIILLLSFTSCTLPARLRKSSSFPSDSAVVSLGPASYPYPLYSLLAVSPTAPATTAGSSPPALYPAASLSPSPSPLLALSPHYPPTVDYGSDLDTLSVQLSIPGKVGMAIAVLVGLSVLICVMYVTKAFKKNASHSDGHNDLGAGTGIRSYTREEGAKPSGNSLGKGIDRRTYTREELANATDNFTTKIGQGASGFVYRANLPGDRIGAVKRATNLDRKLFDLELSVLLRLPRRHPHLVDLIGLCLEAGEKILVFEFISNGSLYDRLHTERGLSTPLSWAARMDIAYQVAVALQYLHEEAKPPILHRDVKSPNVLLVNDNYAKLADFGLSRLGPKNNQFTVTAVRGSYGYMDPQYMRTRRYSAKSDVYSFGVLLLELITGLKSVHEDTDLAEWTETYRLSKVIDKVMIMVDGNLKVHMGKIELQNTIKIANLCLKDISEERPSMKEIVIMMQEGRYRK